MSTTQAVTYTCHLLPTHDPLLLPLLAEKYTQLRIRSLEQAPNAFSGTIEAEESLSTQQQQARLLIPNKHIIIVVAKYVDSHQADKAWYENEWVGQAVLFGPNTWESHTKCFQVPQLAPPLTSDELDTTTLFPTQKQTTAFWSANSLFVDIDHRKIGVTRKLCYAILDLTLQSLQDPYENFKQAEIRIVIHPDNTAIIALYKFMGFTVVEGEGKAKMTLPEATTAAGDQDMMPSDYMTREYYGWRGGLIMLIPITPQLDQKWRPEKARL
jgi:hypothetical protein